VTLTNAQRECANLLMMTAWKFPTRTRLMLTLVTEWVAQKGRNATD